MNNSDKHLILTWILGAVYQLHGLGLSASPDQVEEAKKDWEAVEKETTNDLMVSCFYEACLGATAAETWDPQLDQPAGSLGVAADALRAGRPGYFIELLRYRLTRLSAD